MAPQKTKRQRRRERARVGAESPAPETGADEAPERTSRRPAAQARADSGRERTAVGASRTPVSGDDQEALWSRRDNLVLAGLMLVFQIVVSVLLWFGASNVPLTDWILVLPYQGFGPVVIMALAFVAMPLARRITGRRRMKLFETASFGAMAAIFVYLLYVAGAYAGNAAGVQLATVTGPGGGSAAVPTPLPSGATSRPQTAAASPAASGSPGASASPGASGSGANAENVALTPFGMSELALAEVLGLVATAWFFPRIYAAMLAPRRRDRPRPGDSGKGGGAAGKGGRR